MGRPRLYEDVLDSVTIRMAKRHVKAIDIIALGLAKSGKRPSRADAIRVLMEPVVDAILNAKSIDDAVREATEKGLSAADAGVAAAARQPKVPKHINEFLDKHMGKETKK